MSTTRVRIFYPADPVGVVPGGIDTFIRGIIKSAPADLEFSLVGMSTDPVQRPLGRWTQQRLGQRSFDCFPVVAVNDAGKRGKLPLSLRFTTSVLRHRSSVQRGFDVFDFHRPEPSLLFLADKRPKVATFHQDPAVVSLGASDMLWKHLPGTYQRLEAAAVARFDRLWCVREPGVATLRERYPDKSDAMHFIPTWVDNEVFCPNRDEAERARARHTVATELALDSQAQWIISVGRLDTQKDPALMLEAFARIVHAGTDALWLVVGDGRLRPELERQARAAGVAQRIKWLGLLPAERIAELLRVADLFALSSAYEGMPMAALEALGCGLPVVSTDVGEIRRVVHTGVNGRIAADRTPQGFAAALSTGLAHAWQWRGEPAVAATSNYLPRVVLAPAYDAYRELGDAVRRLRLAAQAQVASAPPDRNRRSVIGVSVDLFGREAARGRLLRWARQRESRYVSFCNVHSLVEARRNERHRLALAGSDLALADGSPVAWTLGIKDGWRHPRVDGPSAMWALCEEAQAHGMKIGLYGSSSATLGTLQARLLQHFPSLEIGYSYAPPFRPLSAAEDQLVCDEVQQSGVGLLFVGLGCPKQEQWMAEHRGRIPAVMLGVGAAFDMHAGVIGRAPPWMRNAGLEWLHRLVQEPGRLWRRYLSTNSRFLAWSLADVMGRGGPRSRQAGDRVASTRSAVRAASRWPAHDGSSITSTASQMDLKTIMDSQLTRMDDSAVDELVVRIDAMLPPRGCRVIEFVASGRSEGTSTIATAFASAHALQWQRKVLLLTVSSRGMVQPSVLQALAAGEQVTQLLTQRGDGVYSGALGPSTRRHPAWSLLRRTDLWAMLRNEFDLVVLDMPSTEVSRAGLKVAVVADGVVVVVEAERARAPVVRDLVERLRAVRGNVMGTVLNKRRYHLPAAMYRWL
jgi:exopolysaccharide biosynthesis WecB/TagA/CpsF family protein